MQKKSDPLDTRFTLVCSLTESPSSYNLNFCISNFTVCSVDMIDYDAYIAIPTHMVKQTHRLHTR